MKKKNKQQRRSTRRRIEAIQMRQNDWQPLPKGATHFRVTPNDEGGEDLRFGIEVK